MTKVMAIDYGSKRVGIASTDSSGLFALPRAVWPNDGELLQRVLDFKRAHDIDLVVIGESKNFKGEDNPISEDIKKFKKSLEKEKIKVVLFPEVLTTMEARQIQGNTDMTDASAAAILLKSYIERS